MTNYNATLQAASVTGPCVEGNVGNGKLRIFTSTYTVTATEPIVDDTITWGKLPSGVQVLGWLSNMNCADGASSSTLTLGTSDDDTAFLSATSVADPAVTTLTGINENGAIYTTSAEETIISTVAGATLLEGQVITVNLVYVQD